MTATMGVHIEFYGIPRARAGVANAVAKGATLGEVLGDLAERFPEFAADCLSDGGLCDGFAANVNGDQFVSDSNATLSDGDSLLILSSDAGG